MESNAEILVGLDKARKEYESLIQGREFLTVRDAHEIRRYAKGRTRLDVDWEELTGEERGWRLFYYKLDEMLADMLGPEKKREMDLLEGKIEAGEAVAAALERLQGEPWLKRTIIATKVAYHKIIYRAATLVAGRAPRECTECNGSCRCEGCKGSGKANYPGYGELSEESCSCCQGSGVCKTCQGIGAH